MDSRIIVINNNIHFEKNDFTLKPFIDIIENSYGVKTIIYSHWTEYKMLWYNDFLNYGQEFKSNHLFIKFGESLVKKDIQFYLVVGCEYNEVFEFFVKYPIPNFHIIYWSTFLLSHNHNNFTTLYPNQERRINKYFQHLFICYNNKTRYHRCEMMDELCKRDLLKNNLYSWVDTTNNSQGRENLGFYEEFECFDNQQLKIDDFNENTKEFTDKLFNMNCFINIVTESDIDALFITEKTYRQLLIGQPFLSLCAKDTHKTLKGYGFELYDEIFDYSFDSDPNYKNRIKGIIDNIERLKGKDYNELYKLIENKVEHNVKLCYKMLNESYLTPKFLLDIAKKHKHRDDGIYSMKVCEDVLLFLQGRSII
jgi:hypothetical protein